MPTVRWPRPGATAAGFVASTTVVPLGPTAVPVTNAAFGMNDPDPMDTLAPSAAAAATLIAPTSATIPAEIRNLRVLFMIRSPLRGARVQRRSMASAGRTPTNTTDERARVAGDSHAEL